MKKIINFIFKIFFKQEAVFWAVENNQISMLRFFIFIGMDISGKKSYGQNLLILAIKKGNKEIVEILIKRFESFENFEEIFGDALLEAVILDNKDIVDVLLTKELSNCYHHAALELAVRKSHIEIVDKLLGKIKIIWTRDTLLINAFKNGSKDIIKIFIKHSKKFKYDNNLFVNLLLIELKEKRKDIIEMFIENFELFEKNDKIFIFGNLLRGAVQESCVEIVRLLVEENKKLYEDCKEEFFNIFDDNNLTALDWATRIGQKEVFDILVSEAPKIDVVNKNGETLLHSACLTNNKNFVTAIIEKWKKIGELRNKDFLDKVSIYNKSALIYACENDCLDIVIKLVEAGAKLDLVNEYGYMAFHYASARGHVEIVRYIIGEIKKLGDINKEAFLDKITKIGGTALHLTVSAGVVDLLVEAGSNLYLLDKYGRTVLHCAALYADEKLVSILIKKIKELSEEDKNAFLNKLDNNGETPLHYAVKKGKKDVVKLLVDAGAKLDVVNKDRLTVLHYAALYADEELVSLLIEKTKELSEEDKNAVLNGIDNNGKAPLHYAAMKGKKGVVELLVGAGAKLDVLDECGNTVLHYAFEGGRELVSYIVDEIEKLDGVDKVAFLNMADKDGVAALHVAVVEDRKAIFKMLLDEGAKLYVVDNEGYTVLHYAVLYDNPGFVRFLIKKLDVVDKVAFLNIVDKNGMTALDLARKQGKKDVVDILEGAYGLLVDEEGHTAGISCR